MKTSVAKEYYQSGKTIKEIAKGHKIKPHQVVHFANKFEKDGFVEENKMAVIKVDSKWVDHIVELLERRNIIVEVPEDYELVERFQSSMNKI